VHEELPFPQGGLPPQRLQMAWLHLPSRRISGLFDCTHFATRSLNANAGDLPNQLHRIYRCCARYAKVDCRGAARDGTRAHTPFNHRTGSP
jgi:hypothetical protein